jgi:putative addiction module component (TIGR02574 family)
MRKIALTDLLDLPVAERLLLVEDLWDSIAAVPEAVELTIEQREELDLRLEAYHRNPDAGSPWDEVKARLRRG